MKVLLILPPSNIRKGRERKGCCPPIGLGYLAAVAEKEGYDIQILDTIVKGYHNEYKINEKYLTYGLSPEEIERHIREINPDIVGVSFDHSYRYHETMMTLEIIKKINKNIIIILGGSHASFFYEELMKNDNIDFIMKGEADFTFTQFLNSLRDRSSYKHIDGLVYRENGRIVANPKKDFVKDMDKIPFPAYHLMNLDLYTEVGVALSHFRPRKYTLIETSRGCPHECHYCSKDLASREGYAQRSAQNIFEEMKWLNEKYDVMEFQIVDYNPLINKKRWKSLCQMIIDFQLKINWSLINGMAVELLYNDEELLYLCRKSGCDTLYLAIETLNEDAIKQMNKGLSDDRVKWAINKGRELGFILSGFFMIGYLGETRESVQRTIDYANSLDLDIITFFICNPLPGSKLFEICRENDFFRDDFHPADLRYGTCNLKHSEYSAQELEDIRFQAWKRFREKNAEKIKKIKHELQVNV